jgi:hypothetical protein
MANVPDHGPDPIEAAVYVVPAAAAVRASSGSTTAVRGACSAAHCAAALALRPLLAARGLRWRCRQQRRIFWRCRAKPRPLPLPHVLHPPPLLPPQLRCCQPRRPCCRRSGCCRRSLMLLCRGEFGLLPTPRARGDRVVRVTYGHG